MRTGPELDAGLGRRALLPMARSAALALLPVLWLFALFAASPPEHPFGGFRWLAWPAAFAVLVHLLRQHVDKSDRPLAHAAPAGTSWLFTLARHWLVLDAVRPALLRAVHQLGGVPFELDALLASTTAKVALSIFWTVLALGSMLFATRRANRAASADALTPIQ